MFAEHAEAGEVEVAGAGEFEAGGDEGGVQLDDGGELQFEAELKLGEREGAAVEEPAAAERHGFRDGGEQGAALVVAEGDEVEVHRRGWRLGDVERRWMEGCRHRVSGQSVRRVVFGSDKFQLKGVIGAETEGRDECCEWLQGEVGADPFAGSG